MYAQSPPSLPTIVSVEDRGPDRIRLRLKQLSWTTVTIAATTWLCTFGPVPGILAIAVAKHVLVAILVMGTGLDERRAISQA
jgi:hypothetical protein